MHLELLVDRAVLTRPMRRFHKTSITAWHRLTDGHHVLLGPHQRKYLLTPLNAVRKSPADAIRIISVKVAAATRVAIRMQQRPRPPGGSGRLLPPYDHPLTDPSDRFIRLATSSNAQARLSPERSTHPPKLWPDNVREDQQLLVGAPQVECHSHAPPEPWPTYAWLRFQ